MKESELQETIIYGGAFNPPTRAHQAILQACIDYAEPRQAEVWLLPSASRADKIIETNYSRRLAFCEALTQDVIRRTVALTIETTELFRDSPTETYDTVRELETQHPQRRFTWVFGADSVATMPTWDHGSWLCENLSMLVINRPGTTPPQLGARAVELAIEAGNFSSTELRHRLAISEGYDDLVGAHVYAVLAAQ